ncbi:MAG: hypothetical protein ACRELG_24195 [Gemmataceae bacterium]
MSGVASTFLEEIIMSRIVGVVGMLLVIFVCGIAIAEVPPKKKDQLHKEANLIITGTVTKVEVREKKSSSKAVAKEEEYRLIVAVGKVEKGKLADESKPVSARGSAFELKPRFVGTRGHRSANTNDRISGVEKGWKLKLYLKGPAKDGTYEIVFPNGFEVSRKSDKKDK